MIYYSTSLTLYSTEIDPRRNLYIDDIGQYLNAVTFKRFDDFKRFTPAESVTVRIPVDDAVPAIGGYLDERYNYAMVEYADETGAYWFDWYYFVSSVEMIADGTLSVTLQLDALNTFRNWKGALTDRTYVKRQLINRWQNKVWLLEPEDIAGDIVKTEEEYITPKRGYLIYDSSANQKPSLRVTSVNGIPFADSVYVAQDIWDIYKTTMPSLALHIIPTAGATIQIAYVTAEGTKTANLYMGSECWVGHVYSTKYNGPYVSPGAGKNPSWSDTSALVNNTITSVRITGTFTVKRCVCSMGSSLSELTFSNEESLNTPAITEVDRTSNTLVKIIEIPFLPDVARQGTFTWDSKGKNLYFSDVESQLSYEFDAGMQNILSYDRDLMPSEKSLAMMNDPKMRTGAFSYYKVVYDSYSCVVNFENVHPDESKIIGRWTASSSMSSSCIIEIRQDDYNWSHVSEDYPIMISSDRNNEIPLYTSEWLNYLRNGYNFDKKSNAMSIATSVLSTVGSLVMGIASIASGGATAAATVPAAVGMASAAIGGWTSTASTINSQLAKETQLKNQSYSVSSVNDLSLFKAYGQATVKIEWWEPREDYKKKLADLFFYRGYAVNRQYKPSLDIRTSFDYIECVPSWSGSFIQRTPPQFISLLNDRLAQGVTIIHHYDNAWDIAQEKGNIES